VLYLTASHSPQGIFELYCCTDAKVYVFHIKHSIVAFISEVLLVRRRRGFKADYKDRLKRSIGGLRRCSFFRCPSPIPKVPA